ncbi:MAG: GntR family transcriptional regulator [Planctomycetes bacterium]|nr:GntR family transcriptional regulator [Planctomycetota bacterium]
MIEPTPLSAQVHRQLLAEIVGGKRTSGTVLRETTLAAELNVSRTPVREALRQLMADGLVELQTNHSAIVRSLNATQLTHVCQVREALEGMATELACRRMTDDDFAMLDDMAAACRERKTEAAYHRFDRELHRTIAERTDNPLLARDIGRYHDLVQLMREKIGDLGNALLNAFEEHLQILQAIRAGDAAAARQAMVDHIRLSCQAQIRHLTEAKQAPATPKRAARKVSA